MASINTNTSALIALQNLNRVNDRLTDVQNRVSTGLKVQGAKDNAAVWAVAQNQRADTMALESVTNSLNRAVSISDVSLAAGEQIADLMTQLRQKVVAAADPGASPATRKAYDDEFQALLRSIQSFADNASFDGANILDGSLTGDLAFLANAAADETIALTPQDLTLDGIGLGATGGPPPVGPSLLTTAGAEAALGLVDTALATVTERLSELGAQSKQIENHIVFISKLSDSLETGIGNLVDADLAKESARLQALQVQQQLGVQSLSIANQAPQVILSLFRS